MPGGAGGVGHLAIQIAVERGARVISTAGPDNHDFLRELGAEPVDYTSEDVPARVHELSTGDGADAALDIWGGDGRAEVLETLRRGGRMVSLASPAPEPCDGYEIHYIFVRPSGYDLGEHITPLVHEGRLKPARRGGLPARARRRGARAPRGRPRAREARPQPSGLTGGGGDSVSSARRARRRSRRASLSSRACTTRLRNSSSPPASSTTAHTISSQKPAPGLASARS